MSADVFFFLRCFPTNLIHVTDFILYKKNNCIVNAIYKKKKPEMALKWTSQVSLQCLVIVHKLFTSVHS